MPMGRGEGVPNRFTLSLVLHWPRHSPFASRRVIQMTIMREQRCYWKIFDPNQLGECPDWIRVEASLFAVVLTHARSTIFQNPEYSEVTTSRIRALLSSASIEELRLGFTESLAFAARKRFRQYSLAESLYQPQRMAL